MTKLQLIKEAVTETLSERAKLHMHIKAGAFHKWLGKSEDEPITAADIKKGKAAGGHAAKMAVFAQNFGHVHEASILGSGMSKEAKARDIEQSDREYIAQRQAKAKLKASAKENLKQNSGEKIKIQEVLKNASASEYVDDFVHSKNKMFKGDSKKQRIRRALGAYYGNKK